MQKRSDDLQLHKTVWLEIDDFEFLCFNLARELLSSDEPIPDYTTHNKALLESALGSPKQTFDGELLYPTLLDQASILFYSLIKNHSFENGNKRIAVISLLIFLRLNKKWIRIPPVKLYEVAVNVSESRPHEKDEAMNEISKFLSESIEDYINS